MWLEGRLEGQPAIIHYESNGFGFNITHVNIGFISFDWDDLNVLQQEKVMNQLISKFPLTEETHY